MSLRFRLALPLALLCLVPALAPAPAQASASTPWCARPHPWCDQTLDPDQRADLLAADLTGDEKLQLLAGGEQGVLPTVPRLGLPTIAFTDGTAGGLPSPLALAATFDTGAASRYGAVIGDEAKHHGASVVFGPSVDVSRTPGGQSFGTDPYLSARLATQWTQAAQAQGVIAAVKTYTGPGSSRDLHETYLPPYDAALGTGGAGMVVCAAPACESPYLLGTVLRKELHFPGVVVSTDVGAATDTRSAASAGLDLQFPGSGAYALPLLQFWTTVGGISWTTISSHVHHILRTLFAFGILDHAPYSDDSSAAAYRPTLTEHAQTALEIAKSSITLLRNTGTLPLPSTTSSVALIGPGAAAAQPAIAARVPSVTTTDGTSVPTAVANAQAADTAVVLCSSCDALVHAVAAANPHTIVVLQTDGPVRTPWAGSVAAVLEAWSPVAQSGTALASVLFGDSDPGGRLPIAFPGYPFGYGLSYTTFGYSNLIVQGDSIQVTVTNTGTRRGIAVPQLYLDGRLTGFTKITLDPGEATPVSFTLTSRDLARWDTASATWKPVPGCRRLGLSGLTTTIGCPG